MGSRWRKSLFGTDAIYEVVESGTETVLVQVIEAPGLRAGMQFRMVPDAFRTMEQVATG